MLVLQNSDRVAIFTNSFIDVVGVMIPHAFWRERCIYIFSRTGKNLSQISFRGSLRVKFHSVCFLVC